MESRWREGNRERERGVDRIAREASAGAWVFKAALHRGVFVEPQVPWMRGMMFLFAATLMYLTPFCHE